MAAGAIGAAIAAGIKWLAMAGLAICVAIVDGNAPNGSPLAKEIACGCSVACRYGQDVCANVEYDNGHDEYANGNTWALVEQTKAKQATTI